MLNPGMAGRIARSRPPTVEEDRTAARDRLTEAYERARAVNYRPGSPEMCSLDRAEGDYERAARAVCQRP